jgi:predicted RNA-binding protein with RPS1 domain
MVQLKTVLVFSLLLCISFDGLQSCAFSFTGNKWRDSPPPTLLCSTSRSTGLKTSSQTSRFQSTPTIKKDLQRAPTPLKLSDKEIKHRVLLEAHRQMLQEEEEEYRFKTRGDSSIQWKPRYLNPRILSSLSAGDCLDGQICRIVNHGAWVNIGLPQDAFLHKSEMSSNSGFVDDPTDSVRPGQHLKLYVKYVNAALHKISLSCFEPLKVPTCWIKGAERVKVSAFSEDEVALGQIVRITKYGAYVDIGTEHLAFLHFKEFPPREEVG